jgi:hypothetical protein
MMLLLKKYANTVLIIITIPLILFLTTLHYSRHADIVKPLHDAAAEKIREYRSDYNNQQ